MYKNRRSSGFLSTHILLIIAVLTTVTAIGYVVYRQHSKKSSSASTVSVNQASTDKALKFFEDSQVSTPVTTSTVVPDSSSATESSLDAEAKAQAAAAAKAKADAAAAAAKAKADALAASLKSTPSTFTFVDATVTPQHYDAKTIAPSMSDWIQDVWTNFTPSFDTYGYTKWKFTYECSAPNPVPAGFHCGNVVVEGSNDNSTWYTDHAGLGASSPITWTTINYRYVRLQLYSLGCQIISPCTERPRDATDYIYKASGYFYN